MIELDKKILQDIFELFEELEHADKVFKTCQSASFREHVRMMLKSSKYERTLRELAGKLEEAEGPEENPAPSTDKPAKKK